MTVVRIVQVLCPARHCIMATAYEGDSQRADPEVTARLAAFLDEAVGRQLNPWCEICRAPRLTWKFDDQPTRFRTLDEAQPELRRLEAEQMGAQRAIRAARRHSNG